MAAIAPAQPNALFFAGDLGQRIFQQPPEPVISISDDEATEKEIVAGFIRNSIAEGIEAPEIGIFVRT